MKQFLQVLQHIVFVIAISLFLILSLNSQIKFECAKGTQTFELDGSYSNKLFTESDIFNRMFGISLSDIISYYSDVNIIDENERSYFRETVSGNVTEEDFKVPDISRFEKIYGQKNSNLKFFIIKEKDNELTGFGNVDIDYSDIEKTKKSILDECSMYVYYSPSEGIYKTNTDINEMTLARLWAMNYESFGENSKIMLGMHKNLCDAPDSFLDALLKYKLYTEHYELKIVIMIVCAFTWLILLFIICIMEAKARKTNTLDVIPIEIRLCILGAVVGALIGLFENIETVSDSFIGIYSRNSYGALAILSVSILCFSCVLSFFVYGLVRRLSCGVILKSSLLYGMWVSICGNEKGVYNNLGPFVRALVPGIILVALNMGIGIAAGVSKMYFLLIIPGIFDLVYIFISYISNCEHMEINKAIQKIASGEIETKVNEKKMHSDCILLAKSVNQIGEAVEIAVNRSLKDEKMKADLITNVSHDLKTPLTSIINYVDLLKKERIDNDNAIKYIDILDEKSQRLKALTEDLIEASKISSGNIVLTPEKLEMKELLLQSVGEFTDKFEEKHLVPVINGPEKNVYINVDPGCMFRIIENLFNNICKYALEGTRVFVEVKDSDSTVSLTIKNISANPINVNPEELTERFIRGDESRNTEGSGLGLSIAKSLSQAMGGSFNIEIDGDMFKVIISFPSVF